MNNQISFNQCPVNQYVSDVQTNILENLPQNIDIFSDLEVIKDSVSEYTRNSYYKLLYTIKKYLNKREIINPIDNNLSKLKNHVDEDDEIQIEWIIRSSYRIGFLIDKKGNISFWRMYKEGTITNTISDSIESQNFEQKIISILNEVMHLT